MEIKFRAWHEGNKEMVYFLNNKLAKDPIQSMFLGKLLAGDFGDVLMQYTGRKDKNGVEIYTGDIVSDKLLGLNSKGVIFYDEIYCQYKINCGVMNAVIMQDIEIIGNIHENPELLEVKND